ncbi:MAG: NAD(P)H-binding protein [Nocardioidaceae bacterium]
MFAITGATGAVGNRVAARLAAAGADQRLVVRDPRRAPELAGAEVSAPAEYADREAMRCAFNGVDTVFLVSARESASRVGEHRTVVDAATDAGVSRIVYLSFQGAAEFGTFTFGRDHWHTEQYIRESGLEFTFLRDSLYLGAVVGFVGVDGVIRGPAGDGRVAAVAHDDVADVAASVLVDGDESGRTYDVAGPEAIGLDDVARIVGRACGRSISYHEETITEAYASRAAHAAAEFEVMGWVSSYQAIAAGELADVTDTVERITGHAPMGLPEYLTRHPAAIAHLGAVSH